MLPRRPAPTQILLLFADHGQVGFAEAAEEGGGVGVAGVVADGEAAVVRARRGGSVADGDGAACVGSQGGGAVMRLAEMSRNDDVVNLQGVVGNVVQGDGLGWAAGTVEDQQGGG